MAQATRYLTMNERTLGILLGIVVLGIAFSGGAAAADSTDAAQLDTQTFDAPITQGPITGPSTQSPPITQGAPITNSMDANVFGGCCCCPVELAASPELNTALRAPDVTPV